MAKTSLKQPKPSTAPASSGKYTKSSRVRMKTSPAEAKQAFDEALRAVRDTPGSLDDWDALERLCEDQDRPDEVAAAYLRMLTPSLDESVREQLARRAVDFHDSWFGDDPAVMQRVLARVLEALPQCRWALEQLVTVLTVAERWEPLLDTYDGALRSEQDGTRRRELLNDAAHVAKDFAESPERAVGYVQQLLPLDDGAAPLAASVERMLEQAGQWAKLIELWHSQIDAGAIEDPLSLRLRIATLQLDKLADPIGALREAFNVLEAAPGHAAACEMLERVLARDDASVALRLEALQLLRRHHDSADRPDAVISVLERSLTFAPEAQQLPLRRELASRLMTRHRDPLAMEHYGEVLRWAPTDAHARAQLERLAERSGEHGSHAAVLTRAAETAEDQDVQAQLLIAALGVHADRLSDPAAAIALGQRVLGLTQLSPERNLEVARITDALLEQTDRHEERVAVLEQRVLLEPDQPTRRRLFAEVARLSLNLETPARALRAWEQWLEQSPDDLAALARAIDLAAKLGLHESQVRRLLQRAEVAPTPRQRRQDLVRIAHLQEDALKDDPAAIDRWLAILAEFGQEDDALQSLDRLLARAARFEELASILEDMTERERNLSLNRLQRLGDIYRSELSMGGRAVHAYGRALELSPEFEPARQGLCALLDAEDHVDEVTRVLAQAYEATDDWKLTLGLLEARLSVTDDPRREASLLLEAAEAQERRAGEPEQALPLVGRALVRAPQHAHVERHLLRLAETTGNVREAAQALCDAAASIDNADPERAADLRMHEAVLREQVSDSERAADAYESVLSVRPTSLPPAHGLARTAAGCGRWLVAASAAVLSARMRCALEETVLSDLQSAASEQQAFDGLTQSFGQALAEVDGLPSELASELYARLYHWHLDHRADPAAAERAILIALRHRADHLPTLTLLADVQRQSTDQRLVATLLKMDQHDTSQLTLLREAAEVAVEHGDEAMRRSTLGELFRRASHQWLQAGAEEAGADVRDAAEWSLEKLVRLELDAQRPHTAIELMDDAARLPFSVEKRAQLRLRAARVHEQQGQKLEALIKGRDALEAAPDDLELTRWLASLCEQLERVPELTALRKAELSLVKDEQERQALRIEIARLCGVLEGRDERLQMLRDNLDETPGHPPSIEAVCTLLEGKYRHAELADLLTEQALRLHEGKQDAASAALWRRAAAIVEDPMGELERATFCHEQAANLEVQVATLKSLVRLCGALQDHGRRAFWLDKRLAHCEQTERPGLLMDLARSQLSAEHVEGAIETLQTAFDERPQDPDVRQLLTAQLRAERRHSELANVLGKAALHTSDAHQAVALARESASLHGEGLQSPEQLVQVVDHALNFVAGDRELRQLRARGLRVLGRLEDARDELQGLLEEFGRRRSAERAEVHVNLAEVLRDLGEPEPACEQLETALSMCPHDVSVMHALAKLGREAGDLPRAERALHALLLNARRAPVELADGSQLGASEVLLELRQIATLRGDESQASSLLESALEVLPLRGEECTRVKRNLATAGDHEVLLQVLRDQLGHATSERARAEAMHELATALADDEANLDEAFELRLSAVESDPGSPELQEAAQLLAEQLGQRERLVAFLQKLLDMKRRPGDAYSRCETCLRLGHVKLAQDELKQAGEYYAEAESTQVREGDVWRAQLRLAGKLGDEEEQERLLALLNDLGEAELEEGGRADVLYRLAEIRLGSAETCDEGVALVRDAMQELPLPARAARLLARALGHQSGNSALLSLFGQAVKQCEPADLKQVAQLCAEHGDESAMATLLECMDADAGGEQLRGAVLLSRAELLLADPERAAQGAEVLRDLLNEQPAHLQAEERLLEYYASNDREQMVNYLVERMSQASDAEAVGHYALKLSAAPGVKAEQARTALRSALDASPDNAELRKALLPYLSGDSHRLERAALLVEAVRAGGMQDAARLSLEAHGLFSAERRPDEALNALEVGRQAVSDDPALLEALANEYRERDDVQSLAGLLVEATKLEDDPATQAQGWREVARLRAERLQDEQGAVEALRSAVALAPEDGSLRRGLAHALLTADDKAGAIEELAVAVEYTDDEGERAELLHLRGQLSVELGDRQAGIADLQAAFELAPAAVGSDLMRLLDEDRRLALKQGDEGAARQATLSLVDVLLAIGRHEPASVLLGEWVSQRGDDVGVLEKLVQLHKASGDHQKHAEACAALVSATSGAEQVAAAQQLVGVVEKMSDVKPARTALEKAHADQPDSAEIRQALRTMYEQAGEHRGLARLLIADAHAARQTEQRVEFMRQAARQLVAAGAHAEAITVLEKLRAAFPKDPETAGELAGALSAEGHNAEARELLKNALAVQPPLTASGRAPLLKRLADVCRAQGDGAAALEAMQAAREADMGNRAILGELARLAEEQGDWEAAERALTSVLLLKNNEAMSKAEALLRRTRVAVHRGSPQRALLWARKALEEDPESDEVKKLVAKLSDKGKPRKV